MTRPRVREDATQLPTTRRTACPEFGGLLGLDGGDPQQPHELTVGVVIRSGIPGPCLPPGRSPAAATYRPGSSVRAHRSGLASRAGGAVRAFRAGGTCRTSRTLRTRRQSPAFDVRRWTTSAPANV